MGKVEEYKTALIAAAVSGKIEVRDWNQPEEDFATAMVAEDSYTYNELQTNGMNKFLSDEFTESELISIFRDKGLNESFFPRFRSQYKIYYDEMYNDMKDYTDEDFEEGDTETVNSGATFVLNSYITLFLKQIENGHSEQWAHLIADNFDEYEYNFFNVFDELKKSDPELAQKELITHCYNLSDEEVFRRYYLYLFEKREGYDKPTERAKEYTTAYNYLINKGKSQVYAHQYARLGDGRDFHETYLQEYAAAYEMAFNRSLGDTYAEYFASILGKRIADVKINCDIDEDDEATDFDFEIINAQRKASEYILDHKLNDIERFCKIYENIHLNTYFPDEGWPQGTEEEIDKVVLSNTLKKFSEY